MKKMGDKGKFIICMCMCIVHTYYSWQKGMSQDEATSNSEEIKPVALSIVELHLAAGTTNLV